MNTKPFASRQATLRSALTSLVLLAAAGASQAAPVGELYPVDQQAQSAPVAVKSRAQVIDELVQAGAAGQVAGGEIGYAFGTPAERNAAGGTTRNAVIAAYRQAASDGTLVTHGEVESTPATRIAGSARTRADVRADAIRSAHNSLTAGNTAGNTFRGN